MMKKRQRLWVGFMLVLGCILMTWPFIQMILGSFMSMKESMSYPPTLIPGSFNIGNYLRVFEKMPFKTLYMNSILTTVLRTVGNVMTCSLAGYAFAKFKFPGRSLIFGLVLAIMMVPGQIFLLPQYMTMSKFGWIDKLLAIWVPNIFSAYGIFFMRQFFLGLPNELIEAAEIDGMNPVGIFLKIGLPLVKPGLLVYGIQVAIASWNDLLWPMVVVRSTDKLTLPVGMSFLSGQYTVDTPALMAAAVMAVVPLPLIYIAIQGYMKDLNLHSAIK